METKSISGGGYEPVVYFKLQSTVLLCYGQDTSQHLTIYEPAGGHPQYKPYPGLRCVDALMRQTEMLNVDNMSIDLASIFGRDSYIPIPRSLHVISVDVVSKHN